MKVLLLNAPWKTETGFGVRSNSRWAHTRKDKVLPFPVYLAYTAAILEKQGFDVKIIDAVASDLTVEEVAQRAEGFDIVFIETTTPSIDYDLQCAESIKKSNPKIVVSLIGPHASVFNTKIMEDHDFIDYVIIGEFEETIADLVEKLDKRENINKIKGITYREGGIIKQNPHRDYIRDLDSLPFPARHLFDMKKYDSHLYKSPSFLMISSRGCPYQCTYCLWPQVMYGHSFRVRSARNVVDEMEFLVKKFGAKEICFDDDTFTIGKERVINICKEIRKRDLKIEWSCFGRVGLDEETLKELKMAGCEHIRYGVESGSQELLNRCKKNTSIEEIKKTFELTKKVGIRDYGTFMFGLPGETWKTVEQTINLAIELDPYAVQFSLVIPFPGTEYYYEVKKKNLLKATSWKEFDGGAKSVIETEELTREDLEKAMALAWKQFYLRPAYIFKSLIRHIKSFQDIKRLYGGTKSFFKRWAFFRNKLK